MRQRVLPDAAPASGTAPAAPTVRCWGARGSVPAPGAATAGFGGNTSCLEVCWAGHSVIFDAGTGIRALGQRMAREPGPLRAHIFLTHFHWDHIQGFPFFSPLYQEGSQLSILGPAQDGIDIQSLFAGQMGPVYFPVPFDQIAAHTSFTHLSEGDWESGPLRIQALRMRHASVTFGYRMEAGGMSLCYIPDNELVGGDYPLDRGWRDRLGRFVEGADLLLHDAMFTEAEYRKRIGWGHSTYPQAISLALEAGVKRLAFFHHDPDRTDQDLSDILSAHRRTLDEAGHELRLEAAREGSDIRLTED